MLRAPVSRTITRSQPQRPQLRLIRRTRPAIRFISAGLRVWKSTNATTSVASKVNWTALTDDQATLSIGSIAIQPGNSNPSQSVILVGTGEADNSSDSYFGLRSE